MALVQSPTKGKKTTFGHLFDDLIAVVLNTFSYWNLIHVVPDRYDIEDSINAGERARRAVLKTLEVKIKGRETHCLKIKFIELLFHTGTGKKRRFIPMHVIAEKLSEEII